MTHFQLIVVVCGGVATILGAISIITGAIVKKNSNEIKGACATQFASVKAEIKDFETQAKERSNRILVMETRFAEIVARLTRLETLMDKNSTQTEWIYAYMTEQKKQSKRR